MVCVGFAARVCCALHGAVAFFFVFAAVHTSHIIVIASFRSRSLLGAREESRDNLLIF
jgi:hypothetical protein